MLSSASMPWRFAFRWWLLLCVAAGRRDQLFGCEVSTAFLSPNLEILLESRLHGIDEIGRHYQNGFAHSTAPTSIELRERARLVPFGLY